MRADADESDQAGHKSPLEPANIPSYQKDCRRMSPPSDVNSVVPAPRAQTVRRPLGAYLPGHILWKFLRTVDAGPARWPVFYVGADGRSTDRSRAAVMLVQDGELSAFIPCDAVAAMDTGLSRTYNS